MAAVVRLYDGRRTSLTSAAVQVIPRPSHTRLSAVVAPALYR
ncbi:MAG: hypothetical protein ACFN4H_08175 [Prevotella sp.]